MDEEGSKENGDQEKGMIHIGEDNEGTIHLQNVHMEGAGKGTAITNESEGGVHISAIIRGFDRAISNRGDLQIHQSNISNNALGYIGHRESSATIAQSRFKNDFADILYHDNAEVILYDTLAKQVIELTGETHTPIDLAEIDVGQGGGPLIDDPELYRIARATLSAHQPNEKKEYANELLNELLNKWDTITDAAETATDIMNLVNLLKWILYLIFILKITGT